MKKKPKHGPKSFPPEEREPIRTCALMLQETVQERNRIVECLADFDERYETMYKRLIALEKQPAGRDKAARHSDHLMMAYNQFREVSDHVASYGEAFMKQEKEANIFISIMEKKYKGKDKIGWLNTYNSEGRVLLKQVKKTNQQVEALMKSISALEKAVRKEMN